MIDIEQAISDYDTLNHQKREIEDRLFDAKMKLVEAAVNENYLDCLTVNISRLKNWSKKK